LAARPVSAGAAANLGRGKCGALLRCRSAMFNRHADVPRGRRQAAPWASTFAAAHTRQARRSARNLAREERARRDRLSPAHQRTSASAPVTRGRPATIGGTDRGCLPRDRPRRYAFPFEEEHNVRGIGAAVDLDPAAAAVLARAWPLRRAQPHAASCRRRGRRRRSRSRPESRSPNLTGPPAMMQASSSASSMSLGRPGVLHQHGENSSPPQRETCSGRAPRPQPPGRRGEHRRPRRGDQVVHAVETEAVEVEEDTPATRSA